MLFMPHAARQPGLTQAVARTLRERCRRQARIGFLNLDDITTLAHTLLCYDEMACSLQEIPMRGHRGARDVGTRRPPDWERTLCISTLLLCAMLRLLLWPADDVAVWPVLAWRLRRFPFRHFC